MNVIKSKENQLYKKIKKLKTKKYRDEYREFLAEGLKILQYTKVYSEIIIKESKLSSFSEYLEGDNSTIFSDNLFDEISTQENSQGIIFVIPYLNNFIDKHTNDLIILDQIQDPGNLGTIIRVVDAVGLKNIVMLKGSCDIYNDKVVRSSMGSLFNVNIEYFDYAELIEYLAINKFNVLSTALTDESKDYNSMNLCEKNAIIFGNEGVGISSKLLDISSSKLIIPIYGKAESLNVSVASGIFLYKYIENKLISKQ